MFFQYLGFHDHTFNRAKLASYVISLGFHKQAFHGQAAEFSCPGFHDKQQNSLPMHCNGQHAACILPFCFLTISQFIWFTLICQSCCFGEISSNTFIVNQSIDNSTAFATAPCIPTDVSIHNLPFLLFFQEYVQLKNQMAVLY